MKIAEKLWHIQTELKAHKSQFNNFGKYKYRSLEDIYEALKPLMVEYKVIVMVDNEILHIGSKLFRKSVARIECIETGEAKKVEMVVQEGFEKKGMSPEQCSGSSSSYCDKYCLSRLLCIDDNQDADTQDNRPEKLSPLKNIEPDTENYKATFGKFNGRKLKEVDCGELANYIEFLEKNIEVSTIKPEMELFLVNAKAVINGL